LTGTPVQNKLDDVFALIKFLRLAPLDDKATWTEFIGTPVKYGQPLGVARLQTIMKCITLRRTKETRAQDGQKILALPPRRDELRYLKFDAQEQEIYNQFFNESKAEFNELSDKNEVMKNYVGILQKILRLRQICDHFELVEGKGVGCGSLPDSATSYEEVAAAIVREGLNTARASAIFALLRESATTQCVECEIELCTTLEASQQNDLDSDAAAPVKRNRKARNPGSRAPTRVNSPSTPQPVLTRCQHLFCLDCYRSCICPEWPKVPPETVRSCSACQTGLGPADAVEVRPDYTLESPSKKGSRRKEKRQKGMPLDNFHMSTKVKALLGDLLPFSRNNPYSANYEPESVEVQVVDNRGNEIDDGIVKTVVLCVHSSMSTHYSRTNLGDIHSSQWTSMLDKYDAWLMVLICVERSTHGTILTQNRRRSRGRRYPI
jgi:SWI/SNF-related matrix-associated actin-dependent regulator of chromatin subfamily A3